MHKLRMASSNPVILLTFCMIGIMSLSTSVSAHSLVQQREAKSTTINISHRIPPSCYGSSCFDKDAYDLGCGEKSDQTRNNISISNLDKYGRWHNFNNSLCIYTRWSHCVGCSVE
jgi:hypothetical protein